jgi:16S rRNA (cytidine1402-2'-O)-methyltransferase
MNLHLVKYVNPVLSLFINNNHFFGIGTNFKFLVGFLPKHGRSRKARLEVSAREAATQIFYVPPHGIHQFLSDAVSSFGDSR